MSTAKTKPRPPQAQEMETGPRRLQPREIEPRYVSEPIRYDDVEHGAVHTPERALLCSLRSLGLLSEAELAETTGFSADVVNDLLDGKRRVPVAVFTNILRWARRAGVGGPDRRAALETLVAMVTAFLLGNCDSTTMQPPASEDDAAYDEPPVLSIHDPADVTFPTARARWEYLLDWDGVVRSLRGRKIVKLLVYPEELDTVLKLADEVMTEEGACLPQSFYDGERRQLWLWDAQTRLYEFTEPNGRDGAPVQALDDPDSGFTRPAVVNDAEPAHSAPNRDREDHGYIECCAAEFRTLDADRIPFPERDWTVVRNQYFTMDWETAEYALHRGKVVAVACKREERAAVETIALYQCSNDLYSHYDGGLLWLRKLDSDASATQETK